jgi:phosphatidate cytidylyltransferase
MRRVLISVAGVLTLVGLLKAPPALLTIGIVVVAAGCGYELYRLISAVPSPGERSLGSVALATVGGLLYCGVLPAYLILLSRTDPHGALLAIVFAVAWGGDVGGHIVGRLWGRNLLCPAASPRKTIEGAAGALVLGVAAALAVRSLYWLDGDPVRFVLVVVLAQLVAQGGDLFESLIKRRAGARHSGTLLGEGGGILDVMDGALLAAPLLYHLRPF